MTIRARALVGWIVCWAVLLGPVAPVVAQALGADASGHRADVCSALGPRAFPAAASVPGPDGSPSPHHSPFEHCSLCSLHANLLGLPPALPSAVPTVVFDQLEPPRRFVAPPARIGWVTAQPRAPPASF